MISSYLLGQISIGAWFTGNVKFDKTGETVTVETKYGWILNDPVTKSWNYFYSFKLIKILVMFYSPKRTSLLKLQIRQMSYTVFGI